MSNNVLAIPTTLIEQTRELTNHGYVPSIEDSPGVLVSGRAAVNKNLAAYNKSKKEYHKHITAMADQMWETNMGYISVALTEDMAAFDRVRQQQKDNRLAEVQAIIDVVIGDLPIQVRPSDYIKYTNEHIKLKLELLIEDYQEELLFEEVEEEVIEEEVEEGVVPEVQLYSGTLANLTREEVVQLNKAYPGRFTLNR